MNEFGVDPPVDVGKRSVSQPLISALLSASPRLRVIRRFALRTPEHCQ